MSELVEGGNAGVCVPCRVAQAISHPNAAPLYVPAVLPLQRESEREREGSHARWEASAFKPPPLRALLCYTVMWLAGRLHTLLTATLRGHTGTT